MVFSFMRSLLRENVKMTDILQPKLDNRNDNTIVELGTVTVKYRDSSVCSRLPSASANRIYLLANDEHDILLNLVQLLLVIIPCKFVFPFIVREPTT